MSTLYKCRMLRTWMLFLEGSVSGPIGPGVFAHLALTLWRLRDWGERNDWLGGTQFGAKLTARHGCLKTGLIPIEEALSV